MRTPLGEEVSLRRLLRGRSSYVDFYGGRAGVSLVELLITLGVIVILTGVAVTIMSGAKPLAQQEIGLDNTNFLNRAVLHYRQAGGPIDVEAGAGSTDEVEVLTLLKTRDITLPGSPLVPSEFPEATSSSTELYRMQWSGEFFRILPPGTAGAGIVVAN